MSRFFPYLILFTQKLIFFHILMRREKKNIFFFTGIIRFLFKPEIETSESYSLYLRGSQEQTLSLGLRGGWEQSTWMRMENDPPSSRGGSHPLHPQYILGSRGHNPRSPEDMKKIIFLLRDNPNPGERYKTNLPNLKGL